MVKPEPGGADDQRRTCGHYASSALPLQEATQNPALTLRHSSFPVARIRSNFTTIMKRNYVDAIHNNVENIEK